MRASEAGRPWTFYAFAGFFALFVAFLYGPMTVIYILSFQGPQGGMTFHIDMFCKVKTALDVAVMRLVNVPGMRSAK